MVQTVLGVEGMMCSMCEAHINDEIRRRFAVRSVKSSRKKKECRIVSEQELDRHALEEAITGLGYELTSVEAAPYVKKGLFG